MKKVFLFICISIFYSTTVVSQPINLNVDFSKPLNEDFLGVNAVFHGFTFLDAGLSTTQKAKRIELVKKMKLKIARTWYRRDMTSFDPVTGTNDFNSPTMVGFYEWLDSMKSANVSVALNLGWWMNLDTYVYEITAQQHSDWVSSSLLNFSARGYDNIRYGFLFTEALNHPYTPIKNFYENGTLFYENSQYYEHVVRTLDNTL